MPPAAACPPGRHPTRPGPPSASTRCCPVQLVGAARRLGPGRCAPTAGRPGSTAACWSPYRRTARPRQARSPAPPTRARCWPAPSEALARYRAAVEELAGGGLDGEAFRGRTRGLRIGVVVDGEHMWLYDAEHGRWVYADGTRLNTYATDDGPKRTGLKRADTPPPRS